MNITVTGATGFIGERLVRNLLEAGHSVHALGRKRSRTLPPAVRFSEWNSTEAEPAAESLATADAIIHLAGEPVAQRLTPEAKQRIRGSRVDGTRNLVSALSKQSQRPQVLVCASAIGYYGAHGEEPLDEDAPPCADFLAGVCLEWERQARRAEELGMRTVQIRTGVVLDRRGGALAKMLPPFRLGVGGPVAGGRQYVSWVHVEDLVGILCEALADERWSGPVNGTAPEPVTNRELSRALGAALHRPALLPVPGFALGVLYGEMAQIVTTGARVLPAKALVLGYGFRHPHLPGALADALR